MATVRDLLKLRNTVQGITIADSFEGSLPVFKIGFRPSRSGLGESQIGRNYLEVRQFPKNADGYKRAIAYFKQLKSKYKNEIAKFPENRSAGAKEILTNYTKQKKKFSQELVDEIKKLTKQKKYKTLTQVENALYKTFNKPKYTVAKSIDPKVVFFNPKTKIFTIPRDFEVYGARFGKRNPDGIKTAIRQIIGTQFFANSPNYNKQREYLTKFYTDSDYKPTDAERNLMRKFVKDFTITRSIASDQGGSIIKNFFRDLNFDFSRKLKDVGKIFNLQEHLKEQIKNPRTSAADKRFFQTELTSLQNDNNTLLKRLKEKFPGLFTSKAVQGGSLQLEHKIARALGETGPLKLPKSYIAKATRVPGRFNQAKYEAFDKPLLKLVTEYKAASKLKKPEIKLEIEKLKNNFNRRTGGYLDSLNFKFGNNVKITDSTPLVSQVKGPDLLFDIDKNIKQSNRFFGSLGEQRVPGLPKAASASDFITSGKEYNEFKKLVNAVKKAPQACRAILDYQTGGISQTCATAIQEDPVRAATKLEELKPTSAALGKVRNAARSFLSFMGLGKKEGVKIFRGDRAGASGKMAKYIPGTSQVEFVPYSDKLRGRFFTTSKKVAEQFADDPSKIKSLTIPKKDFNIGTNLARRINVDQMADQLILPRSVINKLKDGTLKYDSPAFRNILRTLGKGKVFTATAAVGAGAGALVKAFRNDDPTTYLTNDKQANAMILDTADQLEREERQAAVGDAPELLDESVIGAELAVTGAAIPGSKKVFDARRKKGFGAVRAGLGPVGKALSGFATPLGIAVTTPLNVARQVYEGESAEDIITDPLNYLGPAFASTLTKEATVGMPKGGMLNKALRLGMSPAGIRGVTKFLGLPGLALSLGYEGYDQYKKYTEGRGFVYNLLNKDE